MVSGRVWGAVENHRTRFIAIHPVGGRLARARGPGGFRSRGRLSGYSERIPTGDSVPWSTG